ncbi:hypothetical protein [Thermosyntropha sp.]|uniref:hypothetical protein n=1 Tax=Thermosyntropha sp. TaxID=2740820 RepID=UPI0025D51BEC|nr:hypothetical protein [Thermosyntropha sp.]MBO8158221.1 hypothetical protein [Thermosyntropha sp.]
MYRIYSTGPVENAAGNASTNVWVKVLNVSSKTKVEVEIKAYKLNGTKTEIDKASFTVRPNSSDFAIFDITNITEYELQIQVKNSKSALVSVWGKDSNADLVASQRFTQKELNIIFEGPKLKSLSPTAQNSRKINSAVRRNR